MKQRVTFSIIITNYNYARFVGAAIDSALALDWPDIEVIVVDDGSTDGSREIIAGYGGRVTALFVANGGILSASNVGFAAATGDVVIFLDADDLLEPEIAREIAAVWHPGVSKVQVQMRRVDADNRPLGSVIPNITRAPTPQQIRALAASGAGYPSPPGSGNAYARTYLSRLYPLVRRLDRAADSQCIAKAPFFGDVVTIVKPLVRYRIHGANVSIPRHEDSFFGHECTRALARLEFAREASAAQGGDPPPYEGLFRNLHLIQLRMASLKLQPACHPLKGDGLGRVMFDALAAPFRAGFEPSGLRVMITGWTLLTALSPKSIARRLIYYRFRIDR